MGKTKRTNIKSQVSLNNNTLNKKKRERREIQKKTCLLE